MRRVLYWACTILLLVALGRQSSGYYSFLRIVVTAGAVLAAIELYSSSLKIFAFGFIAIAILFNPIIPIYLYDRDAWAPFDIMAAIGFAVKAYRSEPARNSH